MPSLSKTHSSCATRSDDNVKKISRKKTELVSSLVRALAIIKGRFVFNTIILIFLICIN